MPPTPHNPLPASCYIFLHAMPGRRVGMVMRGIPGFYITNVDQRDMSDAEVKKVVDTLNGHLKITPDMVQRMYQNAVGLRTCRPDEGVRVAA